MFCTMSVANGFRKNVGQDWLAGRPEELDEVGEQIAVNICSKEAFSDMQFHFQRVSV